MTVKEKGSDQSMPLKVTTLLIGIILATFFGAFAWALRDVGAEGKQNMKIQKVQTDVDHLTKKWEKMDGKLDQILLNQRK